MTTLGIRTRTMMWMTALLALAPRAVLAAWPSDPTVNLPICTAAVEQTVPKVVSDGAGGAIFAWQDTRGGSTADIYVQRVDASGAVLWTANGVALCTAVQDQLTPTIVSDGAGGAIVAWEDFRAGGIGSAMYAQRVNSSGVPQWAANGVLISGTTNSRYNPVSVSDGAGGMIVAWQISLSPSGYDIHVQRVLADGTIASGWGADGVGPSTAVNDKLWPSIATDGANGAIIAWHIGTAPLSHDVYAQRLNASGVAQWGATGVTVAATTNDQRLPQVASDGANGAYIVWEDTRGITVDIYAQRVNAAGIPQWAVYGQLVNPGFHNQGTPAIIADGAGGAIVAWGDGRNPTSDIFVQKLNSLGAPQWTAGGVALCTAAGTQQFPILTTDKLGGAIVAWEDYRGSGPDQYARRVNAAGTAQWAADGVAISSASLYQTVGAITADGAGGAILAFQDSRNLSGWDVYAQNVSGAGVLGGTVTSVPAVSPLAGLELRCAGRNPGRALTFAFALVDDSPATLEVFDLGGRRIESREVGSLGAGTHVADLGASRPLPAGVYEARLIQGSRRTHTRAVILR